MLQNLRIPHSDGGGGVPLSPFSIDAEDPDSQHHLHVFSTDHFRMFDFKVLNCPRGRSHDWTECPYAHPAEKARRRDPRKYHYSGTACPEFRKGHCRKGDSCEFAHGVFECWLHPQRYRTQLCKDGAACRRRVCFFAHAPDQLRVLAPNSAESQLSDSRSLRRNKNNNVSSPTSVLNYSCYFPESPPSSPGDPRHGVVPFSTVRDLVSSMRNMQLEEMGCGPQMGCVYGSPQLGLGPMSGCEEEPAMERVESGRDIRARMYAKLSRENSSIGRSEGPFPDIGWVSELLK
ncbi:zinc finger CCCH domain-containing protein 20-like [Arachis stenosperma]|uniref:zinc finger CCCH domain-containing protein 20-like n=1 Tax=Arachis stenosperma TaxID=217475 RepID=UPI0025ACB452|nr:zinc finger CCCH domain-containing protein 20-like [Arachis stenosperma]